jgi:hypothetical protein
MNESPQERPAIGRPTDLESAVDAQPRVPEHEPGADLERTPANAGDW